MSPLRLVFLALAIWGTIHPMYWFISHMRSTGGGLGGLIDAWYVNASTTGLVWDLTIAAVALTVWIIAEAISRRDWLSLIAVPSIYCIGVSCGLPLYLFLRSRPGADRRGPA
ncbi:MAG: DUF2834 domain-containing protein [Pseudomonadota bacterium]